MCPSVLVAVSLILSFVSAAVIVPLSTLPNGALRTPQTLPSILLPNNVTNTTTPPFNVLHYQCDDTHYGRNLNPSSCRNVFNYMRRSDVQSTFSERHTGRPNDIPLPIRFLSDDGLCFVQPLLKPGALTGLMSPTQLGQAAYTLLEKCVESRRSGGIAGTIGVSLSPISLHKIAQSLEGNSDDFWDLAQSSFTRRRQQLQCSNIEICTPHSLRYYRHSRPTLAVLPHRPVGHVSDHRTKAVW